MKSHKRSGEPFCSRLDRPGKKPSFGTAAREAPLAALGGTIGMIKMSQALVAIADVKI